MFAAYEFLLNPSFCLSPDSAFLSPVLVILWPSSPPAIRSAGEVFFFEFSGPCTSGCVFMPLRFFSFLTTGVPVSRPLSASGAPSFGQLFPAQGKVDHLPPVSGSFFLAPMPIAAAVIPS